MKYSKVAGRLRDQIARFSGELSSGFCKVSRSLVSELIYGIQASQSVVLTRIARVLEEEIPINKTEERLSRQLSRPFIGDQVQRNLLKMGATQIVQDTLLIFDGGDLRKKYVEKMEYLCGIRDGGEHELASGYWLTHVVGAELGTDLLVPLYEGLCSTKTRDFISENDEWLCCQRQPTMSIIILLPAMQDRFPLRVDHRPESHRQPPDLKFLLTQETNLNSIICVIFTSRLYRLASSNKGETYETNNSFANYDYNDGSELKG